ncbi:oxidoreductase [Algoriphagus sp.]|uniref:oxidoreductase n=1 Tax=Algoriphagus sp. TaxID=1872435 RepID=UPI00260C0892|nr:oxidoreductase [Algoriphagus sp.]
MKIAFIAGTSGLIGMQLLHQILKNKQYDYVLSVGRRKLALKHGKLIQLEGDLSELEFWDWEHQINSQSLGGEYHDLVGALASKKAQLIGFCSLGTTIKTAGSKEAFYAVDHDLVLAYAKWVKKMGGRKFLVVSSMGADSKSSIFYNQVKGKTEEDLMELEFDQLSIVRPSILLGNRSEFRLGEQVASILMRPLIWLKLLKNYRPIYDYQVAKSMVYLSLTPQNQHLKIYSSGDLQELSKK